MNTHVYLTMKRSYPLFTFSFCKLKVMNYENTTYNDTHIPNVSNTFIFTQEYLLQKATWE